MGKDKTVYILNYAFPDRLQECGIKTFTEYKFLEILMKQYGEDLVYIEQKVSATIADIELSRLCRRLGLERTDAEFV